MDSKPFVFMLLCVGVLISATYFRIAIVQSTVDKNHKELMEKLNGSETNTVFKKVQITE